MGKRFFVVVGLVVVVALGLWFIATPRTEVPVKPPATETGVATGKVAPHFSLTDLSGKTVPVGAAGRVTILNFWATWCPPCREEMPQLQQFVQKNPGVAFYAINIQEPAAKVGAFLEQNHFSMPVLLDSDGAVATTYRVNAIPTTVILDKDGVIRFRKAGGVTQAELEGAIKGL
ncbi:MAG: TlpA disulfide reductase family protein [Negativicutes bacterium]|nr:TlpA disulfide reductase family protein [Negativicutes bacterium]